MATQAALLPPGTWVKYNVETQSSRAALPTAAEQTIGIIRQAFTGMDGPYYQVVWNPGSMTPQTGLYHVKNLTALTPQQANDITCQLAAGTYQPTLSGTPGAQYQQPNIPIQAAPPLPPYQRGAY